MSWRDGDKIKDVDARDGRKLERGLLLVFREMHGAVPEFNVHGTKMRRLDEFEYFSEVRLRRILQEIGATHA